jgi:hypothetical protein
MPSQRLTINFNLSSLEGRQAVSDDARMGVCPVIDQLAQTLRSEASEGVSRKFLFADLLRINSAKAASALFEAERYAPSQHSAGAFGTGVF